MTTVFTIGYEGSDIGDFISTLSEAGIEHVADVRDVPVSRKKGFSKTALADQLQSAGIAYSHFKALGDPKEGREAMRRGDRKSFATIFGNHLECEAAQQALADLNIQARTATTALLCYERDPKDCHRTIIAAEMIDAGQWAKVTHLGVRKR